MCGIAGIHARVPLPASLPTGWAKELAPRGPDGVGFLWDAGAVGGLREGRRWPGPQSWTGTALVHRRLAILDRTRAGHQPMVSPDGRHVLVYNGEIYNHVELRQELETAGWKFKGSGDSEVLLAAWSMWGAACLPRLDGMFAFAVLDRELRILHLARDPFGIKPLCYAAGSDGFAFASTPVPLLELPWVSRRADLPRVQHYLGTANGLVGHGDRTMFADVRQVPAGHHMSVNLDDLSRRSQAYWKPPRRAKKGPSATHVRDAFLDNVRRHLRSDVPVGAALSGGIDSSSIVAAMRAVGGPELELHVFSYIPDDPAHSEEPYIDLVAAATGATVHKVQPSTEALQQDLEPLIRAHGEPFGSTSMYAQYCVFRAARAAGVPVLLDGQGADELLAGYLPFVGSQAAMLLRRGRWLAARRLVHGAAWRMGESRQRIWRRAVRLALPGFLHGWLARRDPGGMGGWPPWLRRDWFERRGVHAVTLDHPRQWRGLRTSLQTSMAVTSLPGLLRHEDRNSMAHSVESRVPFLSSRFAEMLLALPPEVLLSPDGETKSIFRAAMRGLVPDAVLDRGDKKGFPTTEQTWLNSNEAWVDSVLSSPAAARIPFIDMDAVRARWQAVQAGRVPYQGGLWRVLNLIEWTRVFDVRYD